MASGAVYNAEPRLVAIFGASPDPAPLIAALLPAHANDRVDDEDCEQNQESELLNLGGHAECDRSAAPLHPCAPLGTP